MRDIKRPFIQTVVVPLCLVRFTAVVTQAIPSVLEVHVSILVSARAIDSYCFVLEIDSGIVKIQLLGFSQLSQPTYNSNDFRML